MQPWSPVGPNGPNPGQVWSNVGPNVGPAWLNVAGPNVRNQAEGHKHGKGSNPDLGKQFSKIAKSQVG